jgi:hypothetical protein
VKTGSEPIFDSKHIAFLQYWLGKYLFYSKSVAIAADLLPLAKSLHLEKPFFLCRLLLGYLYKNLHKASDQLRKKKALTNFFGPL